MTAPVVPLLSVAQRRVLSGIRGFFAEHGYAPTVRELAVLTGRSVSAVQYQLEQLQRAGWIRRAPGAARALVVLDPESGQP